MAGRNRPSRARKGGGIILALVSAILPAACAGSNGEESRALFELERLAFVPKGAASIGGITANYADCSIERPLLMDLFEFSRDDGEYYGFEGWARRDAFQTESGASRGGSGSWPLYLDYYEAEELARRRGMRLPTAKEWLHVATGGGRQPYPWGTKFGHGIANTLALEVGSPTAVGTFERGRDSVFGCYDMYGNVWEWVSDVVPGYRDLLVFDLRTRDPGGKEVVQVVFVEPERDPLTHQPLESSVLGASYTTSVLETPRHTPNLFNEMEVVPETTEHKSIKRVFYNAKRLPRRNLSPDVGARMCADAESYLWATAGRWGSGREARRRVRATGARWAQGSRREVVLAFLEELAAREEAPPALAWLVEGARR